MLFFVRLAKHFFVHALKFRHKSGGTMLLSAPTTPTGVSTKNSNYAFCKKRKTQAKLEHYKASSASSHKAKGTYPRHEDRSIPYSKLENYQDLVNISNELSWESATH